MEEVRFERTSNGLAVIDPIEHCRCTLSTATTVAPVPADAERFRFPVDAAVSVRTDGLSLSTGAVACIRSGTGVVLEQVDRFARESFPDGEYVIELSAPIKLYLRVESPVAVRSDDERLHVDFGDVAEVVVGARSHHERPAATVTTTADPEAMMAAVSTFGSALKTTSPERSYPTLRGHPPAVELGDELDLAGLSPPATGVTVAVPTERRAAFVAAPLAYYLGARVVPGDEALVRTEGGFEHRLAGADGFERTLQQVFFLDCLTRTEGLYPVSLHERRQLDLDLDFAALYERSLAERLETYLSVPFTTLEPHLPDWKLTTYLEPTPTSVETLPFAVDDLAVVRSARARDLAVPNAETTPADAFLRGDVRAASARAGSGPSYVRPAPADSLERAWVGEGAPIGASKATVAAYRNRLDRTPAEGDIGITVVCNDTAMDEERDLVDDIYGDHTELAFDVTVEHDLSRADLADVLATRTDLLHYVGHVDDEGFECADGKLDAATVETVGVEAFLLNACRSYRQGMELIEAGAIGGIVTLSDVLNCEAVTMGRTLAGLLNHGFPLRAALDIAREESILGNQYIVVGDGNLSVAQAENGAAHLLTVERTDGSFALDVEVYPTANAGMGALAVPFLAGADYHVSTGTIRESGLTAAELERFLSLANAPTKIDGELRWSQQVDTDDL